MLLIAHRGCSYENYNQNTIRAFKKAIDDGVKAIEFDVQKTVDDKLIVVHDLQLENVSSGIGEVKKSHSSYIKKIYAKTTFLENQDRIPFLEDILNFRQMSKKEFVLHLELKGENSAELTCKMIKRYLDEKRLKVDDFLISSFHFKELVIVKKILPKLKLAYLCGAVNQEDFIHKTNIKDDETLEKIFNYSKEKFMLPKYTNIEQYKKIFNNKKGIDYLIRNLNGDFYNDEILKKARDLKAFSINVWHKNLTQDFIKKAHDFGFKIFTFTTNNPKDIQKVLSFNVDGFFTDFYKEGFKQIEIFNQKQKNRNIFL